MSAYDLSCYGADTQRLPRLTELLVRHGMTFSYDAHRQCWHLTWRDEGRWVHSPDMPAADRIQAEHDAVLIIDTSYSMGTRGWFEAARGQALKLVGRLGTGDKVGVIAFDAAPRMLAPLDGAADPDAGSLARARQAIKSAALGCSTSSMYHKRMI